MVQPSLAVLSDARTGVGAGLSATPRQSHHHTPGPPPGPQHARSTPTVTGAGVASFLDTYYS